MMTLDLIHLAQAHIQSHKKIPYCDWLPVVNITLLPTLWKKDGFAHLYHRWNSMCPPEIEQCCNVPRTQVLDFFGF